MLAPLTKVCTKCGVEKPTFEFNNARRNADGKSRRCRSCQSEYHRQYYLKNPAMFKAKQERDRILYAERNAEYRAKNKEKARQRIREWHAKNPDRSYQYHVKKYQTPAGRAKHLFDSARKRLSDGFALTIDHVQTEIEKGFCPVTGFPFDLLVNTNGKYNRSWSPYAPSLDKIDPRKPYTNDNTRVVIWQYNVMKGEACDEEIMRICKAIVARSTQ